MEEPRFTRRTLIIGGGMLAALLLLALSPALVGLFVPHFHGTEYDTPALVEDFTLRRADGGTFRLSDTRGRVVVLYFGYTECPDVCPTTLYDLHRARELLGDQASSLVVAFVTIDPDNDTPQKLADYTAAFDPTFIGLYGTPQELQAVYDRFGVTVEEQTYSLTHTNAAFVLDRAGRLRLRMHFDAGPDDMAADLRVLIRERIR
jgi:protein SCO1/2